ncbi:microtubule-associated proteins 1A/1B light chain 3C-like [Hemicordylus capensis]|uniref:microtubule-associated proteins 1A/1B light chain 3C-like n=1 Tax=Hemicordylus capensis TaxID=884348 RepID=UPI002304B155|nr:microtubule-associated proteins 1A/1B light chain 3C-like [Hemicordylus capensis]
MQRCENDNRPFKQRKSLATRMREADDIQNRYPNKIPVVVERYRKEKTLPLMDRTKFLVSQDLSLSQFVFSLRTRLSLTSTQAFYLLVNNKNLPSLSLTISEIYRDNKDEDGFLYMTYASQEMFGHDGCGPGQ